MHVHTHVLSEWPPEQCAHIGPSHHSPMAVVAIYVVVAALACVLHVSCGLVFAVQERLNGCLAHCVLCG